LVEEAAAAGDTVAESILGGAGKSLAELAATAARMASLPAGNAKVCPIGGAFASARVMRSFSMSLDDLLGITPATPAALPADGALRAARHSLVPDLKVICTIHAPMEKGS
jgi:N-acetylglucosamine kinase-like BadF-type ATPase